MTANDKQIGGNHYQCKAIQPWDYIISNNMGYLEGTAVKYITRWKEKNGIEDIKKAIHFLEKLIETYYEQERQAKVAFDEDPSDPRDALRDRMGLGVRLDHNKPSHN